jgi:diacylglycerol O-acyltransferase
MSATEAVMWKISDDPWLRPVAGTLTIVDRPIDADLFRRRVRHAVAEIARLRERVEPGPAPWEPPRWTPDRDFDLDYHLRHVAMADDGSMADLQELVSRWYEDPFDSARPLWQFVIVDGVEDGRGALFCKLHHTISDGIGLLRLSERYMDLERDAPPPPDVPLDAVIAEAAAPPAEPSSFRTAVDTARRVTRLAGWPLGVAQRGAAHAATAVLHPRRAVGAAGQLVDALRGTADQFDLDGAGGSPLWTARSARRHLESLQVPLLDIKQAGAALGASVNDVFVTGAVNAVVAYHRRHGAELQTVKFSFVVSQRQGGGVGGNFFTPVRVHLPVPPASPSERLIAVRDAMALRRTAIQTKDSGASLSGLAGVAQLLPASTLSRIARTQVAGVDFATSNLRGAPIPLYIAGARVLHSATLGPLAGTPFNLTTISYDGSLDMGLLVDPVAVEDPGELRICLEEAYGDLAGAAG